MIGEGGDKAGSCPPRARRGCWDFYFPMEPRRALGLLGSSFVLHYRSTLLPFPNTTSPLACLVTVIVPCSSIEFPKDYSVVVCT